MNKRAFFTQLEASLKGLSTSEKQDILSDFEEHFIMGIAEGKSEEEIAKRLGQPKQIAKEIRATYHLEKVNHQMSTSNILRAVWAVFGLGFFNLVIVLGPFLAIAGLMLSGWLTGLAFTVSPGLVLINTVLRPDTFLLFDLFFSFLLAGLGIFICIGMYYVTRFIMKGFVKYLHFNMKLVKGGMNHA